jgi:SprT protein
MSLPQLAQQILAEAMARFPIGYRPAIRWKPLRVSAGLAYYTQGAIGLSTILLDTPEKLRETLLHEYAHLLAYKRHGKKAANHGPHWQQAMRDLGLEPKVRHNFDCERNQARQRVTYRCAKCGATFVRTRRLPRKRRYSHVACGGDIKLQSIEVATIPSRVA